MHDTEAATKTKFDGDKKLRLRKWTDDNSWWIVALVALSVLSLMVCSAGTLLWGVQPALMGVAAMLAIFCCLVLVMIVRRCTLQGKVAEEPTIIQMAVEEVLDGPPLFPHHQRRRSSVATIPRCSIPTLDMVIDQVRRQSIHGGSARRDSTVPGGASAAASAGTTSSPSGHPAAAKKDTLSLAPIAELPKTPTMQHISHGTSLPK